MITSDKRSISRLVDICHKMGIKNIVFSPGSRNAPLVISFVESHLFNCLSIPDERTAAFFAMGMAISSGQTTAICCTSGSAALNYAPAISEAYYQGVPLLVLTADRPVEWIDQGIGQSIRQNNVYNNYIKAGFQLIQEAKSEKDIQVNDKICIDAIRLTQSGFKGPVHINLPLAEPLYGTTGIKENVNVNVHAENSVQNKFKPDSERLKDVWRQCKRKVILVGLQSQNPELESLLQFWQDTEQIVVLTETASNCFVEGSIQTIDRLVTGFEKNESRYKADLLISIGGPVVSKKIKAFFLHNKPVFHWYISEDKIKDSYRALTDYIPSKAFDTLNLFRDELSVNETIFQKAWLGYNKELLSRHDNFLETCTWSDLKVFKHVLESLPQDAVLHMGNSTVVRYVQLFDQRKDIEYHGNRGVSGIDGCSSTALGFALLSERKNILISGDIAFYYDSNAFWHEHLPSYFRIILINNQGGSIFRIIPGPSSTDQLKKYFESYQEKTAEDLCKHHGISYSSAYNKDDLAERLDEFFDDDPGIKLLEIFTPREVNDKVLDNYFKYLHTISD